MKICLLARPLFVAVAAATSPVLAADIVLTPPAGGGVAVTNAAGSITRLRVADDGATLEGNLVLPAASSASAGTIFKGANRFIHNTGTSNIFIGENAGNFTMTGESNTASGFQALHRNTTGNYNTANGFEALNNNANGFHNTASGYQALWSNTTGNDNTASGYSALHRNTIGWHNTASGAGALFNNTTGDFNTASGSVALLNNTTGNWNTASGVSALASNTTGYYNTASGADALYNNTTGAKNTAVGYFADVSSGALTNATAIGYGSVVDASNKIRLGNSAVTVIEGQVAYTYPSDRNSKENLRTVDAQQVLEKLRSLSVTSWNYIGHDPAKSRHYGPMAQDFFAAFGRDEVGQFGTDTTINSGDITAILMVGLQGLDAQVREGRRTIEAQADEIAAQTAESHRQAALLAKQTDRVVELERDRATQMVEIAGLKQAVADVAELRRETARMARLLERLDRQTTVNTAAR